LNLGKEKQVEEPEFKNTINLVTYYKKLAEMKHKIRKETAKAIWKEGHKICHHDGDVIAFCCDACRVEMREKWCK